LYASFGPFTEMIAAVHFHGVHQSPERELLQEIYAIIPVELRHGMQGSAFGVDDS
jgi:hypothetical protein